MRDERADPNSTLTQCFHFEFERSWEAYYRDHVRSPVEYRKIQLHSAGAVATAVPMLLAFLLLLNTRDGLPQRAPPLDRLNRARARTAKRPLLDHIEVRRPAVPGAGHGGATSMPCCRAPGTAPTLCLGTSHAAREPAHLAQSPRKGIGTVGRRAFAYRHLDARAPASGGLG